MSSTTAQPAFIALDWGTSSFRAYLADRSGVVIDHSEGAEGITKTRNGAFEDVLERRIGNWDRGLPVLASGMITSRQGWIEVPYVSCPAGLTEIAAGVHRHRTATGRSVLFVPGLSQRRPADAAPDVMRGEETQVLGAIAAGEDGRLAVLPGTHSKWVLRVDGRIDRFATFMTGEVFEALKTHTILGRLMTDDTHDATAFARGVRVSLSTATRAPGLLHDLFGARTLGLLGDLPGSALASYLSGLLIGAEIAGAVRNLGTPSKDPVVIGSPALTERYLTALQLAGTTAHAGPENAAVIGLSRIAAATGALS